MHQCVSIEKSGRVFKKRIEETTLMGGMSGGSADNVTGRQARQHGRSSDVGRRLDGRDDQRGNGGGGADRDGGGQIQAAQQTLLGQTRFRWNIGRNDLRRFDGRHIGLLGQWQTINGRHFQSVWEKIVVMN